ncbi:MAG: hypothetical protein ACXV5U_03715 [Ilumatobacteraceae bacterium]
MFRRGWKQADATVIVARNFVSTADGLAGMDSKSELVIEVHPSDGEAFRSEAKISYLGVNLKQRRMSPPEVGETIRVEYDPKSHDVKVLLDETHDRKMIAKQKDDAFRSALDAPIGSAAPMRADVAAALDRAGLGDLLHGATTSTGSHGEIVIESAPQVLVQSDGEEPVTVTSHPLDPSFGGAADIMANGVPCTAVVLAVVPLPGQKTSMGEDATGLVMLVTVPGFDPYQAQTGTYVPPAALALLAPGVELTGKAIVGTNDAVAIDWAAFMRDRA